MLTRSYNKAIAYYPVFPISPMLSLFQYLKRENSLSSKKKIYTVIENFI